MPSKDVLSVKNGQSVIVTFNSPTHNNTLSQELANNLFNALKNVTTDKSVRAVLLNAVGDHFMAGFDMDMFKGDFATGLEKANQIFAPYHNVIREIQAMDKPVIAAVKGNVFGPGLSLALACDMIVAAKSARFCCTFTPMALSPDGGCSYFLPRKIGMSRALELMYSCREFDALEAEKLGLVLKVVDDAELESEAMALLGKLAGGPTKSYGAIRKLALKAFEQDLNAHLGLEHAYIGASMRSFDFKEYLRATASNRAPTFSGT